MPEQRWSVEWYTAPNGNQPARTFVESLESPDRARALALIERLRMFGHGLREPYSKPVMEGVFELRSHHVRLLYTFRPGRRAVLLNGVVKKQDRLPRETVSRALALKREIEKRRP